MFTSCTTGQHPNFKTAEENNAYPHVSFTDNNISYISDLVSVRPKSSYVLDQINESLLPELPKEKMLSMLSARSFRAAAPCLWDSLPAELLDI